jgi:hypothetical protein
MSSSIQDYLFRRIKEKLPADASLADIVAELLHVSNDSAYRRIRGETLLVLEETKILCDAFCISLDQTINSKENSVVFTSFNLNNDNYSFKSYLKDILHNLKMVSSVTRGEIIYLTQDPFLFFAISSG